MLKSFKSYLLLGIKLFDFFSKIIFWNIWINVLMELPENLQVTPSNQSQRIKVKSEVYLEPIWKFIENFSFCHLNSKKLQRTCLTGSSLPTSLNAEERGAKGGILAGQIPNPIDKFKSFVNSPLTNNINLVENQPKLNEKYTPSLGNL